MQITLRAGTLNLKGPQSTTGIDRVPQEGFLVLAGLALTLAIGGAGTIATPAGTVTFHGLTPSADIITFTIVPPAGSLVFKGPARPAVVSQMPAGSLLLTGQLPQATVSTPGSVIGMPSGVLTFHGLAPDNIPNVPINMGTAGSVVLSGQYIGVAFSPHPAGSLVWAGLTPSVVVGGAFTIAAPAAGVLTLSGQTVSLFLDQGPAMPVGTLAFIGYAPRTGHSGNTTPAILEDLTTLWTTRYQPVLHAFQAVGMTPDDTTLVVADQAVPRIYDDHDLNTGYALYLGTEF